MKSLKEIIANFLNIKTIYFSYTYLMFVHIDNIIIRDPQSPIIMEKSQR